MKKYIVGSFVIVMLGICFAACGQNSNPKQQEVVGEDVQEEIVITKKNQNEVKLLSGKTMAELVQIGQDDSYYCNLEENMRGELNSGYEVLMCKDPVYDIVYYVNYGRDFYIYALRNGVSELVVEIPARSLYCRNGELYFMAETYGLYKFDGFMEGNILKYNPIDGTVCVIIKEPASQMVVYPDGICYMVTGETVKYDNGAYTSGEMRYFFSFAEQEKVEQLDAYVFMERYKDSYFANICQKVDESSPIAQYYRMLGLTEDINIIVGAKLQSADKSREIELQNMDNLISSRHWIYNDELFFVDRETRENENGQHADEMNVLMAYNLKNGEYRKVVQMNKQVYSLADFFVLNDVVYFGDFLRISLSDGEQSTAQVVSDENMEAIFGIDAFYTDGDGGLYGLCDGKIWRIEEVKNEETDMIEQREGFDGLYVTHNAYLYHLMPIGGNVD